MKLQKPTFDSTQQVYVSVIKEGIRCEAQRNDEKQYEPNITSFYTSMKDTFTDVVIQQTKGWFSKVLTKEWLDQRIFFHIPTESIPEDFEGRCIWELQSLRISKEKFDFLFGLVQMIEAEKVMISFDEPEPQVQTQLQTKTEETKPNEETVRRFAEKQRILKLRARAARALFYAERATQEYCQVYGEDTDWETTDDETD
jgi:hypothetical protein